jgi:hypothetical protein
VGVPREPLMTPQSGFVVRHPKHGVAASDQLRAYLGTVSARQRTSAPGVGEVKAPSGTGTTHPWMPRDSSGWLDGVVNCLHAAHAVLEDERVDGVLRLAAAADR